MPIIGGVNFPDVTLPENKQVAQEGSGDVLDRLYGNVFEQEPAPVAPPIEQQSPLDRLYAGAFGQPVQQPLPPEPVQVPGAPNTNFFGEVAQAVEGSPGVSGVLKGADTALDWLNNNVWSPIWNKIEQPVNKVLTTLDIPYRKVVHPVLANIYAERFGLDDNLRTSLDDEKKLKAELENLKALTATTDNMGYYNSRKAEYDAMRERNAAAQWNRLKEGLTKPVEWQSAAVDAAISENASVGELFTAVAKDLRTNIVATGSEIEEYERDAPVLAQLGGAMLLDPLNFVFLPANALRKGIVLANGYKFWGPVEKVWDIVWGAEHLKGAENAKLLSKLNPFRLTPASQAAVLANEATDTIMKLARDTDISTYLSRMLVNPDDDLVVAATRGLSQSAPVKRLVGLLHEFMEKNKVDDIVEYVNKLNVSTEAIPTKMVAKMVTDFADIAEDVYKVSDTKSWITTGRDAVNNVLSIMFMGLNPAFAFRNAANNLVTALIDGVSPFKSTHTLQRMADRIGMLPIAAGKQQAFGSQAWRSSKKFEDFLEESAHIDSITDGIKRTLKNVNAPKEVPKSGLGKTKAGRLLTSTLDLGGNWERYASQHVFLNAWEGFWRQAWGRETRDLIKVIKAADPTIPPETLRYLRQELPRAMRYDEVQAIITQATGRNLFAEAVVPPSVTTMSQTPEMQAIRGALTGGDERLQEFGRVFLQWDPRTYAEIQRDAPELLDLIRSMMPDSSVEDVAGYLANMRQLIVNMQNFEEATAKVSALGATQGQTAVAWLREVQAAKRSFFAWYDDSLEKFFEGFREMSQPKRRAAFIEFDRAILVKRNKYVKDLVDAVEDSWQEVGLTQAEKKLIIDYHKTDMDLWKRYAASRENFYSMIDNVKGKGKVKQKQRDKIWKDLQKRRDEWRKESETLDVQYEQFMTRLRDRAWEQAPSPSTAATAASAAPSPAEVSPLPPVQGAPSPPVQVGTATPTITPDSMQSAAVGAMRNARELLERANIRVVNLPNLSDAQSDTLVRLMQSEIGKRLAKTKAVVDHASITVRDQVLLDYARRRNINGAMQWVYPYNFWYTGTYANWAWRLASNPALISHYARMKDALHEVNQEWYREMVGDPNAEVPDYYARQLRMPWFGSNIWIDFERALNPLQNILFEFNTKERMEAPGGQTYKAISGWGPSVFSPITWSYAAWLNRNGYKEAAQQYLGYISPASKFLKATSALYKKANLPGASMIPAGGTTPEEMLGHPFVQGGDVWERRRIGYFLAKLWLEGEISAQEMEQAAYDLSGDAWDRAAQLQAEYRAAPNILGFLLGAAFKGHGELDVQVDRMWNEWSELWDAKSANKLEGEDWEQAILDFSEDYPWANAVRMSRELDPMWRLYNFTFMVLRRLPPGEEKGDTLEKAGISDLVDRFYQDSGRDNYRPFSDWEKTELDTFMAAIGKLANDYDVPTPDQAELFLQAKLNHNHLKELAKDALYRTGYENAWDVEKIQAQYYTLPKGPERETFLLANPILTDYWDLLRNVAEEQGAKNPDILKTEEQFYMSEDEKLNEQFWDKSLPPGSNWKYEIELPPYIDAMFDPVSRKMLTTEQKRYAVDWLAANLPAKYSNTDEWPIVKRMNDQFQKQIATVFGENFTETITTYAALGSDAAKKAWREANPTDYNLLKQYWDMKSEFGDRYPVWKKYYGFGDSASGSGSGYASTSVSSRYYSSGGSRSYSSGGSSGGGVSAPAPAPAPATTTPSDAYKPAERIFKYESVAPRISSAMTTPGFIALVTKLFGAGFLSKLRAWLALSGEDKLKWMRKNRVAASQIDAFVSWFATQDQTGEGAERTLASIPKNAPISMPQSSGLQTPNNMV